MISGLEKHCTGIKPNKLEQIFWNSKINKLDKALFFVVVAKLDVITRLAKCRDHQEPRSSNIFIPCVNLSTEKLVFCRKFLLLSPFYSLFSYKFQKLQGTKLFIEQPRLHRVCKIYLREYLVTDAGLLQIKYF